MMPSDSGRRRAASGGALERRKMATVSISRTAATIRSVLRVRRFMWCRQNYGITSDQDRGRTWLQLVELLRCRLYWLHRGLLQIGSVLRVRRFMWCRQNYGITSDQDRGRTWLQLVELLRCRLYWLHRGLLQFGVEVNRSAGYVKGFCPVRETLLFDDNLMAAGSDRDCRGRVADKRTVDFDVRAERGRVDNERGLSGGGWSRGRRGRRGGYEVGHVQVHIAFDKSGDHCACGDRNILAVDEEEQRCGRKENNGRSHHGTGHCSNVTAALVLLRRS